MNLILVTGNISFKFNELNLVNNGIELKYQSMRPLLEQTKRGVVGWLVMIECFSLRHMSLQQFKPHEFTMDQNISRSQESSCSL